MKLILLWELCTADISRNGRVTELYMYLGWQRKKPLPQKKKHLHGFFQIGG